MSISFGRRCRIVTFLTAVALTLTPDHLRTGCRAGPRWKPSGRGVLVDSDNPGTGEQWGRAAGRDLAFSGFNLSLFDVLKWGPVSTASVGIAFDGQITTGTLEELSFSAVLSNLTGGEAVWTGQTRVELFDAAGGGQRWENVNTQFVLTVTGSLILDSGTPRVDVLAVPGPFTAHLEMLAQHPSRWSLPTGAGSLRQPRYRSQRRPAGADFLLRTASSSSPQTRCRSRNTMPTWRPRRARSWERSTS